LPHPQFSSALRKELAISLNDYMASPDAGTERLREACDRVCTEVHAHHLSSAQMELALRQLYAELPGADDFRRRESFDHFLSGCVKAYQEAGDAS
jgi:hypothetical protein